MTEWSEEKLRINTKMEPRFYWYKYFQKLAFRHLKHILIFKY